MQLDFQQLAFFVFLQTSSLHVKGAPEKTESAKKKDLAKFAQFLQSEVGHDLVDSWTPAVSKQFQKNLIKTISEKTGKPYKATSINRTMATVRHLGRWLHQQRPLLACLLITSSSTR
jgi:integrase/recombinase XerD